MSERRLPRLTEPGMKYYMSDTLKVCHLAKDKYFNIVFNVVTIVVLVIAVTGILYYRYKGMPTDEEKLRKSNNKKTYILGKIQEMQKMRQNNSLDLITNLPISNNNI